MATFRPPRERIDRIAARVLQVMRESPNVEVADPAQVIATVRRLLTENLREEHAIEEEALEMLRQHGQKIYEQNADFQKLLLEGKKVLARKKGFTL